ncbi:Nn.00g024180.m01.CDS01 [Neocucurbitaria sp. VM-36]
MPGIYSPSPSHARAKSRTSYFDPVARFSFATETSERQVTDSDTHETRKRALYGEHDSATTPSFTTSSWAGSSLGCSHFTDTKSPPPLAHDRYELAGGAMDGSQQFRRQNGDYDDYFQLQKQRGMWSIPPTPQAGMVQQLCADGMQTTPNGTKSWTIMGLVGGVAGKLFQFCTVPFRGFQAGGGQKYNLDSQDEIAAKLGLQDDPYLHQSGPVQQSAPGGFPSDNYGVLSIDSVYNERPRMTKRLRTADNWVVVDTDGEMESRPSTPRLSERRLPEQARSPSQIPRPVSRAGAATPSMKRLSLIPVSRRSTMDRRSIHGSAKVAPSSHTRQRSYSRMSYGSPVMFDEKASKPKSPLPKESQRLINKVRREEFEEDARMRRMSSQMSAMLREAREALGSKFEVEEFDDGDGADDADFAQPSSWYPR